MPKAEPTQSTNIVESQIAKDLGVPTKYITQEHVDKYISNKLETKHLKDMASISNQMESSKTTQIFVRSMFNVR